MLVSKVGVKENTRWKNLKRGFKVNQRWESARSGLKTNRIWSDVKSGMDSYAYEAQRIWEEIKVERDRRKSRTAEGYLVEEV